MENKSNNLLTIPGAIIIAAAIVAIAIIYVKKPAAPVVVDSQKSEDAQKSGFSINVAPVTATDHILGNPNAPIKIVEYSDPSCPYCKTFNPTMIDVMDAYGPSGKVAWIYRAFPLDTPDSQGRILHPNAGNESRALECVASLGGNEKFWKFEQQLYGIPATATGLDQSQLPIMAKALGIDTAAFNACLASKDAKDKVDSQSLSGANAGVSGTPTSFFVIDKTVNPSTVTYIANALVQYHIPQDMLSVSDDKKLILMSGALPKAMVTGIIDSLLK
jgi:protein-disulfide isomerase